MPRVVVASHSITHGSLRSYLSGFVLSLAFTLTAYEVVSRHLLATKATMAVIIGLALTQFMVQLVFFLYLGRETRPRWKLAAFLFMIMVVVILVLGSLWIMANLDYHHSMSPQQTTQYIIKDEGIQP